MSDQIGQSVRTNSESILAVTLLARRTLDPSRDVAIGASIHASQDTHIEFIDGAAIRGQPLQRKIAAGNVPSFVDLTTDGWGTTIQDALWPGNATKFDPDGRPLSPPDGITFNGPLGPTQGIIATSSGDIRALGISKRQLLHYPKGDWTRGRLVCEGDSAEPCKSFTAPFHLAIDGQDRIRFSDSSTRVFRFPASDPGKVERFRIGYNDSGFNIDSQGNVWVTHRFGAGLLGLAHLADMATGRRPAEADRSRDLADGRCPGDQQLAGHRQLLPGRRGSVLDALRRAGCSNLLRDGEAGPRTADRSGAAMLTRAAVPDQRRSDQGENASRTDAKRGGCLARPSRLRWLPRRLRTLK